MDESAHSSPPAIARPNGLADVGYAPSQRGRKELEEGFGWCKTIEGLAAAAYNLVRLRKLLA